MERYLTFKEKEHYDAHWSAYHAIKRSVGAAAVADYWGKKKTEKINSLNINSDESWNSCLEYLVKEANEAIENIRSFYSNTDKEHVFTPISLSDLKESTERRCTADLF